MGLLSLDMKEHFSVWTPKLLVLSIEIEFLTSQEFRYFDFVSLWEQMSSNDKSNKEKAKIAYNHLENMQFHNRVIACLTQFYNMPNNLFCLLKSNSIFSNQNNSSVDLL